MPLSSATIPIYLSDSPLAAKQKKCTVVKSTTGKTTTWPNDPAIACTPATSFHTNMNSTPATLNAKPQTIFYASFAQGTMLRRNLLLGRRLGDGGEVEVGRDFSVCVCVDPTRAIVHQRRMIEKKLALGMRNIIANSPDAHDVIQCIRAISFLINIFELDTALNTEAKATEMKNQVHYLGIQNIPLTPCDPDLLEKLSPVAGISYDERGIQGSSECMPGTRVGVLTELMAWASDPESPPIYLLTGMAGAGKTAIARSFARLIDAEMFLGASFFCSRATEGSSDAGRIIPSLAFHLAWHSGPYAQALISAIKMNPGTTFHLRPADFQFATLLLRPSQAITQQVQVPIIVIDALDECSSIDAVRAVLTTLIQSKGVRLKFFITSRPEPHIEKEFHAEVVARRLRLRDIEHDITIQAAGWPSDSDLQELVLRTGDLFIFASTAIQYLSAKSLSRDEVQRRLHNIIYGTAPTKIQTAGIDTLYGQIVDNAWAGTEPDEKTTRQKALTTLLCLREPLSLTAIAGLLEETPDDLKTSLADFHSVLSIPASFQDPVTILHASFPDYMTNSQRAGPNMLDVPVHHAVLSSASNA
ncbi:hypothetical protein B0H13DRAFT_2338929 [Mycena leptocephala]|nr:hypothetical protein B0H13DRAFT_2338929 [Mycena leptocephala]